MAVAASLTFGAGVARECIEGAVVGMPSHAYPRRFFPGMRAVTCRSVIGAVREAHWQCMSSALRRWVTRAEE
jgi:hypothetical protein